MSPIALNSTYTGTGNGNNSFGSPNLQPTVDAPPFVDVHATARRTPEGGLLKVESEGTVYDDAKGEIRARFTDKGVACTSEQQFRSSRTLLIPQCFVRDRRWSTFRQEGRQDL
jgi:hypothetical protein